MQFASKLNRCTKMLKKLLGVIMPTDPQARAAQIYRSVINDCARIGGELFGAIPAGNRREFFCLDEHTWVWHEEWTDATNTHHAQTTRYDIRPHGIFKAQDGQPYQPLSYDEAERLYQAASRYQQGVHEKFDPLLAAV